MVMSREDSPLFLVSFFDKLFRKVPFECGRDFFINPIKKMKYFCKKMQKKLFFFVKKYYAEFMYKPVRKG